MNPARIAGTAANPFTADCTYAMLPEYNVLGQAPQPTAKFYVLLSH